MTALAPANWYEPNARILNAWLEKHRHHASDGPRCAVFDFDNTCIFNDVGDATFRRLADQVAFHGNAAAMQERLRWGMHETSVEHVPTATAARLEALASDITTAFERWHASGGDDLAARVDYRTKLGVFYNALAALDTRHAYIWLATLFEGYDQRGAEALAAQAFALEIDRPTGTRAWHTQTAGKAGHEDYRFASGLRAIPEMIDLMHRLNDAGIQVFIVTASLESVVRGVAEKYGYPVPSERIFGMRLEESEATLKGAMKADYPPTYRQGKVDVIKRFLPAAPLLVAGDADTDYEMLTGFPETEIRLIINRHRKGAIAGLYGQATTDSEKPGASGAEPITLLQGRDESAGGFHPTQAGLP